MHQLVLMYIPASSMNSHTQKTTYGLEKYQNKMCTKLSSEEIVLTKDGAISDFQHKYSCKCIKTRSPHLSPGIQHQFRIAVYFTSRIIVANHADPINQNTSEIIANL